MSQVIGFVFSNPLILYGAMFIAIVFTAIYGLMSMTKPITRVMNCGEADRRMDEITVTGETPKGLRRDSKKNPHRWCKYKPAFLCVKGGQRRTTYFAKRGSAYTWNLMDGEEVRIGSFWDALNTLWSAPEQQKLITKIPEREAQLLRNNQIWVTVDLEAGYKPPASNPDGKEFQAITEEDLATEGDKEMARIFAEGAKGATRTPIIPILLALGSGGLLITLAFGLLGWLHIGK